MTISSPQELETLRGSGRRLALVLDELVRAVKPGIATIELDVLAERLIRESDGDPAFQGYRSHVSEKPYPASICTSINDEVVTGSRARSAF